MTTAAKMRETYAVRHNAANAELRTTCKHDGLYWYAAPNDERGWLCVDCGWSPGEEPGYSPEHDRDHLETKCHCILHDMADAGLVSVSNGSHGDGLAAHAAQIARDARTLDQQSIVAILAKLCAGDGKFWRERHESILAGKDNRNRCKCGKLSHVSRGTENGWEYLCDEHASTGDAPW